MGEAASSFFFFRNSDRGLRQKKVEKPNADLFLRERGGDSHSCSMLLASKEMRRRGGEALQREVAERAASFARSVTAVATMSTSTSTSIGRALLFSFASRACSSSRSSSGPFFSSSPSSSSGREEEEEVEAEARMRGYRSATEAGLGVAPLLLRLTPPPSPTPRLRLRLFFYSAKSSHDARSRRHYGTSASRDGGDDEQRHPKPHPQPQPTTTTATSIADALRLPPDSLRKLDLSGGSADLRCVNLLCERVGRSCVCRLSLALSRVAERQGGSLAELSLARNGIEELPGAVWLLGGGGSGGGSDGGGSSGNESPAPAPSFRALRRIDLSGNRGLKMVCGIGRGAAAAMPALREVVVDRGVRVEEEEEGGGGGRREGGRAVEVVEV